MKIVFLFFVFFFGHVLTNVYNMNWKRLTQEALKKDVNLLKKSICLNKTELHKAIANIKETISYVKAGVLKNITNIKRCMSGNILTCNKIRKHDKNYIDSQEMIRNINTETLQKTNETIVLAEERKMEIFQISQKHKIVGKGYRKMSDDEMIDFTQKLVACRMLSSGTALMTVELVNTTVLSLQDVLRKAGKDIRNLSRWFLNNVKALADMSTVNEQNPVNKAEAARGRYDDEIRVETISKISEVCINKLHDYYNVLAKTIMDLAKTGSEKILEMASNHTEIIKSFKSKNTRLNRYIRFATNKINNATKQSSEKYKELAATGLKGLKQLTDSCEKSFIEFVSLAVKFVHSTTNGKGREYEEKMKESISEFDDVKKAEFIKVIDSVQKSTSSVLEDSIKKNEDIRNL